jgi:hypothetical protein
MDIIFLHGKVVLNVKFQMKQRWFKVQNVLFVMLGTGSG